MITSINLMILLGLVTAILISYFSMPIILKATSLKNWIEKPYPDQMFKGRMMPGIGGIGIFAAFLISFLLWGSTVSLQAFPFLIAGLFVLFLVGIEDDFFVLDTVTKLTIQTLAATLLVIGADLGIANLGGLFGVSSVSWLTGTLISIFLIVGIVNAFNLINQIDGLAGGIGIIASFMFGLWFWVFGFGIYAVLSLVLSGALIGFLIYNSQPSKISIGDTGCMMIGYIIAFLTLSFISLNNTLLFGQVMPNPLIFAAAVLIIPIIDSLRVIVIEMVKGKNPFNNNRHHLYHRQLYEGIPQHVTSFILWMATLLITAFAFLFITMNPNLNLIMIIGTGSLILPSMRGIHKLFQKDGVGVRKGEAAYDL